MAFPLGERTSWEAHVGHILVSVEGYDAIQCEPCGFVHVVPLPSAQELEDYYRTSFYEESKPDYFASAERDREWLNIGYDMKLDMLDEALAPLANDPARPRRVLDIGSGPGHFLLRAKERGWTPVGLETSPAAVEFSRALGVEVHEGYFDGSELPELGQFDAVHMQHVLEHAPDPVGLLEGLPSLLKPGGVICIEVPNDFSIVQDILHNLMDFPAWWVAPPEHLNYFTRGSLDDFLTTCGFAAVDWSTRFPIDLALIAGFDYVNHAALGRDVHQRRVGLEVVLSRSGGTVLRDLYSALSVVGVGRELVAIARMCDQGMSSK